MGKSIYLIRGSSQESHENFYERILRAGTMAAELPEVKRLKFTFTHKPPTAVGIIPFRKQKIAAISVEQSISVPIGILSDIRGFSGVYQVSEALPVTYQKTWPDREISPGICLLTLFRKRTGIDRATFLDRWHNSHTPLSLRIHPLWNYNRNVVELRIPETSEAWDGIVEEHFRSPADLLNPIRFFGPVHRLPCRMWQVYSDTKRFLDYKTIEPYFAKEVHVKSQGD